MWVTDTRISKNKVGELGIMVSRQKCQQPNELLITASKGTVDAIVEVSGVDCWGVPVSTRLKANGYLDKVCGVKIVHDDSLPFGKVKIWRDCE